MTSESWQSLGAGGTGTGLAASSRWADLAVREQVAAAGWRQRMQGRQRAEGFGRAVGRLRREQAVAGRAGNEKKKKIYQ